MNQIVSCYKSPKLFDQFVNEIIVVCADSDKGKGRIMSKDAFLHFTVNFTRNDFYLKMKKADRFDITFDYKFKIGLDYWTKTLKEIFEESQLEKGSRSLITKIETFAIISKLFDQYKIFLEYY